MANRAAEFQGSATPHCESLTAEGAADWIYWGHWQHWDTACTVITGNTGYSAFTGAVWKNSLLI